MDSTPTTTMLTLQLLVSGPLLVCVVILLAHSFLRRQPGVSRVWRAVATFSLFFAPIYCLFAFFFVQQMAAYVAVGS